MEQPSSSSSSNKRKPRDPEQPMAGFASITEDITQNILNRLPAVSFAYAACVSKSWNQICHRILSKPKISSALSLSSPPDVAVVDVLKKVLFEPIRPHFAIAAVFGDGFHLKKTLLFLEKTLGSRTPIVLATASGIMGRDAITNEFKEVMLEGMGNDGVGDEEQRLNMNSGIILTVGYVPGLKVDVIPLLRLRKIPEVALVDEFIMDIKNYAASTSDCASPLGIIMFGDGGADQKPILEKLDCAISTETIIVGNERTQFLYRSETESRNVCGSRKYFSEAVALVFAKDRDKPHGIGEIQFHAALSNGVSAIGPRYKAVSVRETKTALDHSTWLTARREGQQDVLDGQRILNDINDELENRVGCPDLYIGITKRRKCSVGLEKPKPTTSLAFHEVIGGDEEYLFVDGVGIRTGDCFQFYHSDPSTALSSCTNVSMKFRNLNLGWNFRNSCQPRDNASNVGDKEFVGGFIFSCCGRGESFFGRCNVDSFPFLENFPSAPLAGMFCGGEIGRFLHESQEEITSHLFLHVYSTVYLVVSYTPAPIEH